MPLVWPTATYSTDLPKSSALEEALAIAEAADREAAHQAEGIALPTQPVYPPAQEDVAESALLATYPVWELFLDGRITAANLLAAWLWKRIDLRGSQFTPSNLIGENVFSIFAAPENFVRIAAPATIAAARHTFPMVKSGIDKKLLEDFPEYHPAPYLAFCSAMLADSRLRVIYEAAPKNQLREWNYHLTIMPPEPAISANPLEFEVLIFLLHQGDTPTRYLVLYRPTRDTVVIMRNVYTKIQTRYHTRIPYIIREKDGDVTIASSPEFDSSEEPYLVSDDELHLLVAEAKAKHARELAKYLPAPWRELTPTDIADLNAVIDGIHADRAVLTRWYNAIQERKNIQ